MKELFILGGPTAVGKTEISINLAKRLNGEIISADSMQIYKNMDIGSAKIKPSEMEGIPHYLIDVVTPSESFSAAEFKSRAETLIDDITSRRKLPMVVGGTGLYINSLIYNYDFTEVNKDEAYRQELQELADTKGKEYVHHLLKDIDPAAYERLYPNDLKRVIRALEVYKLTGKTMGEFNQGDSFDIPYHLHYFVLIMDRQKLYNRINKRVDILLERGLIEEVKRLREMGYTPDMQAMKGIGYKEILYYLEGAISLEKAVDMIKQGSRNYAKRQLTWFRKDPRVTWIDKDLYSSEEEIVEEIIRKTKGI